MFKLDIADQPIAIPRVCGKVHPFWALQVFGWSAYFLVHMLVLANEGGLDARTVYGYVSATAAGFSVTLLMRLAYRRWTQTSPGLNWILVLVLCSFLGANGIMIAADLIKLTFWHAGLTFVSVGLLPYLQRLYWWFLYCAAWSILYFGFQFWKSWKLREQRTARAIALAEAAQIRMLRYRMNPQFLSGALDSIRKLMIDDKKQARALLTELSEYLRYGLIRREQTGVLLCAEIEAVRHFLAVRSAMLNSRLQVAIDVDQDAEDCSIPCFVILPLAERVAEAGMKDNRASLRVRVAVRLRSGCLRIEVGSLDFPNERLVESSGAALPADMENVRHRLEDAYPGKYRFEVYLDGGLVSALVEIERG